MINSSKDINLAMVFLMSSCIQLGSVGGSKRWCLLVAPGRCSWLVLVWRCPCGEVNCSAEGLCTLPWVVMARLNSPGSHATASVTKLSMAHCGGILLSPVQCS